MVVPFHDHDGLGLELVFNDRDPRPGWSCGAITREHSIRGFFGVEIWADGHQTAALLSDRLDHRLIGQSGNRRRLAATDAPGNYVDVVHAPERARHALGRGQAFAGSGYVRSHPSPRVRGLRHPAP